MKKICVFAVLCCWALPLFAEESLIQWSANVELMTPANENYLAEAIGTGEYNWRTAPLSLGRLSGFGRYEQSDSNPEWTMRHSSAYAPMSNAPFLALAVEYGANQERGFLQGGVSFIASRLPSLRERFQHLTFSYFSDIRDAPASSEWVLRFGTQQISVDHVASLLVEGIYRYRPSDERARDTGSIEFWLAGLAPYLDIGASLEKESLRGVPFLGMRLRF